MGTYLPVSISNGRIPVLNYDIRERRRRDIHLIIYVSGSNISLNIMYVLSLGVFLLLISIINKSVFNLLNVTPCFVSIYMHTIYTVQNN